MMSQHLRTLELEIVVSVEEEAVASVELELASVLVKKSIWVGMARRG